MQHLCSSCSNSAENTKSRWDVFQNAKYMYSFGVFVFVLRNSPLLSNNSLAYTHAINQISTMMLMGSPAVIPLLRHGQQHSWELICTPICSPHNKYMQAILSKKMEYLISHFWVGNQTPCKKSLDYPSRGERWAQWAQLQDKVELLMPQVFVSIQPHIKLRCILHKLLFVRSEISVMGRM